MGSREEKINCKLMPSALPTSRLFYLQELFETASFFMLTALKYQWRLAIYKHSG